ncbi:MAG: thioredoxin family protein [Planctomycetota bacterium]|jgi:hypothetical protein
MILQDSIIAETFAQALPYAQFVATGEPEGHRPPWDQRYGARKMNVLCMTGTWCGDCALQGSAMARVAEANPQAITLRFIGRSERHAELVVKAQLNGGFRVPITWFMAEDMEPVSVFGDRTLSRYRSMARKQLGPAATVVAEPPADPVRTVLQEVLDEFERVQLLLRLSTRLRQKHGD